MSTLYFDTLLKQTTNKITIQSAIIAPNTLFLKYDIIIHLYTHSALLTQKYIHMIQFNIK